jgi:aspartate/methionine/tyrosine aminotransferase
MTDIIDLSTNDPSLIREALFRHFNINDGRAYEMIVPSNINEYSHQPHTGYAPFVKYLEDKHKAPVVITNGAKQALSAVCYALFKMDKRSIGMRAPFFPPLIKLIEMHHLCWTLSYRDINACMMLLPNNPDSFVSEFPIVKNFAEKCISNGIPVIHDASYYDRLYLPEDYPIQPFGSVQIFSCGKKFGLSSLRVGYAVCYDEDFYKLIKEYVALTTSGVALNAQIFADNIMHHVDYWQYKTRDYNIDVRDLMKRNRKMIAGLDKEMLEVPEGFEELSGPFAWLKKGPKLDQKKSGVKFADGSLFGDSEMVRINLAVSNITMEKAIERLRH